MKKALIFALFAMTLNSLGASSELDTVRIRLPKKGFPGRPSTLVVNKDTWRLDLSNRNLSAIPPEVFQLGDLPDLNLSNNRIADPAALAKLASLKFLYSLNLSSNPINDFSPLENLASLNRLTIDIEQADERLLSLLRKMPFLHIKFEKIAPWSLLRLSRLWLCGPPLQKKLYLMGYINQCRLFRMLYPQLADNWNWGPPPQTVKELNTCNELYEDALAAGELFLEKKAKTRSLYSIPSVRSASNQI